MARGGTSSVLVTLPLMAGLAYTNWVVANEVIDISAISEAGPARSAIVDELPPLRTPIALTALGETLARPLFNETRRPKEKEPVAKVALPAPAAVEPVAPAKTSLRLLGTMRSDASAPKALVQVQEGKAQWVGIGAELAGWTLKDVVADAVVIENGGHVETLELYGAPAADQTTAK